MTKRERESKEGLNARADSILETPMELDINIKETDMKIEANKEMRSS